MKEIRNILQAYHAAIKEAKQTALATVVKVEGSSYRRPGARMLVDEDGHFIGAISGGCLEGDALRKALLAINQQQNKLVTYDTTDEDDAKFGVQLGCNGIVHILFEPIQPGKKNNPIHLLQELVSKRQTGVLVTLFSLDNLHQPGTAMLCFDGIIHSLLSKALQEIIMPGVNEVLQQKTSSVKLYENDGQIINAFIEAVPPPVSLLIAGAGNDAQPLVEIAFLLGWETTIIDGRQTHANTQRFPKAKRILVAKPEDVLSNITLDERTVMVIMTHNYNYDLCLLKHLLTKDCTYIGILGPKKKLDRMVGELEDDGIVLTAQQHSVIHSPVGLDIGAETPDEIALSIAAEIQTVVARHTAISLKEKQTPIHNN